MQHNKNINHFIKCTDTSIDLLQLLLVSNTKLVNCEKTNLEPKSVFRYHALCITSTGMCTRPFRPRPRRDPRRKGPRRDRDVEGPRPSLRRSSSRDLGRDVW